MRKIDLTQSPESHCPRWNFCSISKCPVSRDYDKLQNDSSDPSKLQKEKCTSKRIRVEIGKAFGLKFGGMTSREFNGAKNWEKLTDKQKEKKKANLLQNSPLARYNLKGYKLVRKAPLNPNSHKEMTYNPHIMPSVGEFKDSSGEVEDE